MASNETTRQERDNLIITLFLSALSLPETERESFLRAACSEDTLAEVQRRLDWERRLDGFLLKPVAPRERLDRPFSPGEKVLQRFRIVRVAGEGGMGVVYEALDEKLGRRIALKCPRFEFRRRLPPEAVNSLRVTHANVCRVFEIHTAETVVGDVDFLTMEFIEGETLASRLETAPAHWLERPDGVAIARQICAGLNAIHSQGVIHRDLKSGNVMLSTDAAGGPRAVITDFGIAQGEDVWSSQARGTPDYISPELWRGQPASPQSDIYALGVLLYEMACGHKPFPQSSSWQERLKVLPPSPGVREPIRSTILRCLHPDPLKRFQTAMEVEDSLSARSRRWAMGAVVAAAGAAISAPFVKDRFWPSSPVRLAVLPPAIDGSSAQAALIRAFLQDVSYRLKTLRGIRRKLAVYSPAEAGSEGVKTAADAKTLFSATHAVATAVRPHGDGWSIVIELTGTGANRGAWRLDRTYLTPELTPLLFRLQSDVIRMTTSELALRAEPRPETLNRAAYSDYLQGVYFARIDYEKAAQAIPYFEKVIALAPGSALGYAGLAEALLGVSNATGDKSQEGKAQTALAKAEQLDPDLAPVHLISGRLNLAAQRYERALADLHRASELDPNDAQAYISMGYALYFLDRYQESEAAFHAACAAQPGYYKPRLDLGLFYFERGSFAKAESTWQEALRLNPKQTRARLNLATLYLYTGRLTDAEKYTVESLAIRKSASGFELLGDLRRNAGRYAEAASSYESAIRVSAEPYKVWASLGTTYRLLGRETEAVGAFRSGLRESERARSILAREAEPVAWCAFYWANLGDAAQARALAEEANAMFAPGTSKRRVRKRLVLVYGLLHDADAALQLLEAAPPDFIVELDHSPELSPDLRRDPRFNRLKR